MEEYLSSTGRNQFPSNDVIKTQGSVIEEIFMSGNTGYVTISYGVLDDSNMLTMQLVTLVVDKNTIIQDRKGRSLSLKDLREGMVVDAVFSPRMTFSIPPQSRAYKITVTDRNNNSKTTVGRVLSVDPVNGFLYTGNANNIMSQMRFVITNDTLILNRNGNRISLRNIRPGQRVRVQHANFQTASIPPQTTAFVVQVI